MLRGFRARLRRNAGHDEYAELATRRVRRRWALAAAAILGALAIGAGGYAIGSAQVNDADSAAHAGLVAGERRGSAVGTREGYARAFKPAREHAYDKAYRDTYIEVYRRQFEKADLSVPDHVKVSGP